MQKQILTLVSIIALIRVAALAQGTLQVSNLGLTPTASIAIGSDSWIAQGFDTLATDPNTYTLDSVQLLMNPASGNPGSFSVSIYTFTGSGPILMEVGGLSGTSSPSSSGIYTYTASGITISPHVFYYVVATTTTPVAQGSYAWSAVQGGNAQNGYWNIDNVYYSSSDGSTWTPHGRQDVLQMAIYASAVPEPSTLVLTGLGLAVLSLLRCRLVKGWKST